MLYTNSEITNRRNRALKISKTIQILLYCILIPIMIYNVSLIIQSIVNPSQTPSFFGIKSYVIISRKYGAKNKYRRYCYNKKCKSR